MTGCDERCRLSVTVNGNFVGDNGSNNGSGTIGPITSPVGGGSGVVVPVTPGASGVWNIPYANGTHSIRITKVEIEGKNGKCYIEEDGSCIGDTSCLLWNVSLYCAAGDLGATVYVNGSTNTPVSTGIVPGDPSQGFYKLVVASEMNCGTDMSFSIVLMPGHSGSDAIPAGATAYMIIVVKCTMCQGDTDEDCNC